MEVLEKGVNGRAQARAIGRAIDLGKIIQIEHQEVAELYRRTGEAIVSGPEIVSLLKLDEIYGVNKELAHVALGYAIRGYNGGYGHNNSYSGLIIDENELEILKKEHLLYGSKKSGNSIVQNKKGIHRFTKEEREEWNKNAGRRSYELKKGIHARTKAKMKKDCLRILKQRGYTPWKPRISNQYVCQLSEIETAIRLWESPDNKYQGGLNRGRTNRKKAVKQLNNLCHDGKEVRTILGTERAIREYLCKQRKDLNIKRT